ncbi:unnamed protein product [Ixodes pacificus]
MTKNCRGQYCGLYWRLERHSMTRPFPNQLRENYLGTCQLRWSRSVQPVPTMQACIKMKM